MLTITCQKHVAALCVYFNAQLHSGLPLLVIPNISLASQCVTSQLYSNCLSTPHIYFLVPPCTSVRHFPIWNSYTLVLRVGDCISFSSRRYFWYSSVHLYLPHTSLESPRYAFVLWQCYIPVFQQAKGSGVIQ